MTSGICHLNRLSPSPILYSWHWLNTVQFLMFSGRLLSPPTRHTVTFCEALTLASNMCSFPLKRSSASETTAMMFGPSNDLVSAPSHQEPELSHSPEMESPKNGLSSSKLTSLRSGVVSPSSSNHASSSLASRPHRQLHPGHLIRSPVLKLQVYVRASNAHPSHPMTG